MAAQMLSLGLTKVPAGPQSHLHFFYPVLSLPPVWVPRTLLNKCPAYVPHKYNLRACSATTKCTMGLL